MTAALKSYPYPVLGHNNDIEGIFHISPRFFTDVEETILEGEISVKNETFEKYINEGTATYVMQLDCTSTSYRRTFTITGDSFEIRIPAGDLRDRVDVSFYICATRTIDDYDPIGTHPALAGDSSKIDAGDVIGFGQSGWFVADKSFDPLKAPVTSFIKIREGRSKDGPMEIDYDDSILILLSKTDFKKYKVAAKASSAVAGIIHSSIVLPALVETINLMNGKDGENYASFGWYSKIKQISIARKISLAESFKAAQALIGYPVSRSLKEVIAFNDLEEE